jgi:hypothetical protein
VAPVRRCKPAEPRRTAARWLEGKPEAKPQGGAEGGREKAARLDRGSAQSSVGNSRSERAAVFGKGRSVLRNGDFPGAAGLGPGRDCPTRSRRGVSGSSQTWPRGAREASAERLLGVASRLDICRHDRATTRRLSLLALRRRPQRGGPLALAHLTGQFGLDERKVVRMGDADAAARSRQDGEGIRGEGVTHHFG